MNTPILGASYVARSVNAADNRMVNLYPEAVPDGGKEAGFLTRAPGLRKVAELGTGPIRGVYPFMGYSLVVSGPNLYKLESDYTSTLISSSVAGSGPVAMADNGTQVFLACDPNGYIYTHSTSTLVQITDEDYPGAVNVQYLDGYFVFNEPDSQKMWITSLLEGTTIDPLDFASAEGSPDMLISLVVDHREVWLFGTNSVEVWYNAGTSDFPLTRIQGEMGQHLGVGLGAEPVPLGHQLLAQGMVIFNNPVVHHHQIATAITMGMGVFHGRRAMGRPAGMPQPDMGRGDNGVINDGLQLGQLARRPMLDHPAILEIDNPR